MKTSNILQITLSLAVAGLLLAGIAADVADSNNIRLPSAGAGNDWPSPPWDCCDNLKQSPIRIFPPKYQCLDEVSHCAAACKDCKKVPSSGRFVCRDMYWGLSPGSKCTTHADSDDGLSVADDGSSVAATRPWNCCDLTKCTRSWPPTCSCLDKVSSCSAQCQTCEQVESRPPRFRCLDRYHGFPGPKCQ
uniref:Bowman-Birk serine protease inhibitors family domain-containing protein n=1 Tax=Leersia perrieri TaxID=77586 RepID=A0A0D9UWB9_9ORYZ